MDKSNHIDILDEDGNPTNKTTTLAEANQKGKWHAGVHIALYTRDRRILLQRRNMTIAFYPGLWDMGCGGTVASGESIYEAAMREVEEALGVMPRNLEFVTRWKYNHHVPTRDMHVKVMLYAFIAEIDTTHFALKANEAQDIRLLSARDVHHVLFRHKGLPQVHLEPYEGYYRKLLTAIEQRFKQTPQTDTIEAINEEGKITR